MASLMDIDKTFIELSRLLIPASDDKKIELLADITNDYLQKTGI